LVGEIQGPTQFGRHNLKQFTVSREAASVSDVTVASCHEHMKELTRGYKREDIWNVDESDCFFRALPDKTLAEKKMCLQR